MILSIFNSFLCNNVSKWDTLDDIIDIMTHHNHYHTIYKYNNKYYTCKMKNYFLNGKKVIKIKLVIPIQKPNKIRAIGYVNRHGVYDNSPDYYSQYYENEKNDIENIIQGDTKNIKSNGTFSFMFLYNNQYFEMQYKCGYPSDDYLIEIGHAI